MRDFIDIDLTKFQSLIADSEIIFGTKDRPMVLRAADNHIIKLFYRRHFFSRNTLFPKALRFKRNAEKLTRLGFHCANVVATYRCRENNCYIATYPFLEGEDLRSICNANSTGTIKALGAFIANLHNNGIFFRSLHMGNVIRLRSNEFALIDIADVRYSAFSLTRFVRARNIKHLIHYKCDSNIFTDANQKIFLESYFFHAQMSQSASRFIMNYSDIDDLMARNPAIA